MTTGAWYHLSTLETAKDEYSSILYEVRDRDKARFAEDPPKRWSWRHFRSIPMTFEEYREKCFSYYYSRFYYAFDGVVERYIRDMDKLIGYARRSEQNLVYLTKDDIRHFGECLTKPYEGTEFLLKTKS